MFTFVLIGCCSESPLKTALRAYQHIAPCKPVHAATTKPAVVPVPLFKPMVKDINLVVSLSDQLFQLVHFGVIAQVTAVEDSIDCRSSAVEETKK